MSRLSLPMDQLTPTHVRERNRAPLFTRESVVDALRHEQKVNCPVDERAKKTRQSITT